MEIILLFVTFVCFISNSEYSNFSFKLGLLVIGQQEGELNQTTKKVLAYILRGHLNFVSEGVYYVLYHDAWAFPLMWLSV